MAIGGKANCLSGVKSKWGIDMKVGDLVKTIYRDEYAIVTRVWFAVGANALAAEFVYPSDGYKSSQPMQYIKEVISGSR